MMDRQKEGISLNKRKELYGKILKKSPFLYETVSHGKEPENPSGLAVRYVLAPALVNFVLWVLAEAKKRGIQRLYFLARDGYLMYHTACWLCERMGLTIQCRYLYCSRYSVRIPLYHLDMEQALEFICRGGLCVTPEKIMDRAGLKWKEGKMILEPLAPVYPPKQALTCRELEDLKRRLWTCPQFLKLAEKHSREKFNTFCGYLKQEGLLEEIPSAFVDSGWLGSMQKLLNQACTLLGRKEQIQGFYWGLYEFPKECCQREYHCYFFSPFHGLTYKLFFNNCLFEAVFTAPHGMTLGYEKKDGYVPILGSQEKKRQVFLSDLKDVLEEYVSALSEKYSLFDMRKEALKNRRIIKRLCFFFMSRPTIEEADFFGNLSFSDDVLEGQKEKLAAPLSEEALKESYRLFRIFKRYRERSVYKKMGSTKERRKNSVAAEKKIKCSLKWENKRKKDEPANAGIKKKPIKNTGTDNKSKESAWFEGSAVLGGKGSAALLRRYTLYKFLRLYFLQLTQKRRAGD